MFGGERSKSARLDARGKTAARGRGAAPSGELAQILCAHSRGNRPLGEMPLVAPPAWLQRRAVSVSAAVGESTDIPRRAADEHVRKNTFVVCRPLYT